MCGRTAGRQPARLDRRGARWHGVLGPLIAACRLAVGGAPTIRAVGRPTVTVGWPATLAHGPITVRPLRLRDAPRLAADQARQRGTGCAPWEATTPGRAERRRRSRVMSTRFAGCAERRAPAWPTRSRCWSATGSRARSRLARLPAARCELGVPGLLDRPRLRRSRHHADRARARGRPLFRRRSAAPGRDRTSGPRTRPRRVVEKLGFRLEGTRERYIHIAGDWRDHLSYALTVEEVPGGLLRRWLAQGGDAKLPR